MPKGNGWVKIHRKILYTDLTPGQFKFFVGSILLAPSPKSKNCGLVELSIRQLANELQMSRSEVWRREKELEKLGMVTLLDKGFIITNYNYYQTGATVPYKGQQTTTKTTESVPSMGLNVPPEGQTVSPTRRSVPNLVPKQLHKTIKKVKKVKNIIKYILPEWINKDTFDAFLEMRKRKRAVPTQRAIELLIKELDKLRKEGNDPNEVLNQSIMRSYTGVFPLKNGNIQKPRDLPKEYTPDE